MKKGFTLIELLAVIVILSVIALIATPMILNVIEESKKSALEASVKGIIESTRYFAINNDGVYEFIFDENNKGVTPSGDSLNYTGSVEAEGKLILDREGNISLCLMNDKYYVYKNYNSGVVVGKRDEDSCNVEYDSLTNKYIAFLESEGSVSNVYSKDEVDNLIDNVNTNIINNTNEITNVKTSIETLQNDLSNYALKSELEETNTNVENLSSIVNSMQNSQGTIRYDETTDMIQLYYNGQWINWQSGKITVNVDFINLSSSLWIPDRTTNYSLTGGNGSALHFYNNDTATDNIIYFTYEDKIFIKSGDTLTISGTINSLAYTSYGAFVQISTDGATWTNLHSPIISTTSWTDKTFNLNIDLSSYVDKEVQLRVGVKTPDVSGGAGNKTHVSFTQFIIS